MSDISGCIIKILADNGVSVEQTDIWKDNGSVRNVKSIIELNFSAHDKVFEDKIEELKKDYKTVSQLLGKYQQENESLKNRIIELENFSCQAEQETETLVEKLMQRIAELESKETEKPTKYITVIVAKEINGQTYVTLDDFMSVVNDLQAEIGT